MPLPDEIFGRPWLIKGSIQHYAWGARNEEAFIPRFLNIETEADKPYAELWLGAHPKAPSKLEDGIGFDTLEELIEKHPTETLGKVHAKTFQNKLPFLLKVLSAAEALSIQAHPNKKQAIELHARDPEHYPDDNHKPEIAIALDELQALVGFRELSEIKQQYEEIPEISEFIESENHFSDKEINGDAEIQIKALKRLYSHLISKADSKPEILQITLNKIKERLHGSLDPRSVLFLELREKYPEPDIGLLSIFLFNYITLKPGQGIFLKAGIPHAYLKGNIIECMANSDNVVRAGLTPKFKDSKTLVEILTYENGLPEIFTPANQAESFTYPCPIPDFRITALNKLKNKKYKCDSIQIGLVCEGKISVSTEIEKKIYHKGQSFVIPADVKTFTFNSSDCCKVYLIDLI